MDLQPRSDVATAARPEPAGALRPTSSGVGWPRRDVVLYLVVAAVSTGAALVTFGGVDASDDEAYTQAEAHLSLGDLLQVLWVRELNGAPHTLMVWGLARVGLDQLPVLRGLSLAAGLAALGLCLAALRGARALAGIGVMVSATALLAVFANPLVIADLLNARTYALSLLLASLSLWLLLRAADDDRATPRRYWLAWGVVNGVLLYAHFLTGPLVAAQVVWLLLTAHDRARDWGRGLAVSALIAAPLAGFLLVHGERAHQLPTLPQHPAVSYVIGLLRLTNTQTGLDPLLRLGVLGVVVVLAVVGLRSTAQRSLTLLGVLTFALPFAFDVLAAQRQPAIFLPHYLIASLTGLMLVVAAGLAAIQPSPLAVAVAGGLVLTWLGTCAWILQATAAPGHDERSPWSAAAAEVHARARPGDVVTTLAPFEFATAREYLQRPDLPVAPIPQDAPEFLAQSTYPSRACPTVSAPRLWVASAISVHPAADLAVFARCGGYAITSTSTFGPLTLALLTRTS